ncbi:MAG: Holliday junction branch migration protein RuvA [Lentimicrobiaceae bacterium]|jgi:Holliday junction DNA helicase RuvA|nr:Holliday junction branch migration protein RuvA [Lentimicrobiaceae bacterium]
MYAFIRGKVVEKNPASVVIENNGIGYIINISLNTFSALHNLSEAKLYTYLVVREDAHILYGFIDEAEKELFLHLISVSGVGPNTARMILSSLTTAEATEAIASGDAHLLQSVKGIGGKTAQRIVIDLKDKVSKLEVFAEKISSSHNTVKAEALSGLMVLGFNKNTVEKVLDKLLRQHPEIGVEVLIKESLKLL